MPGRCGFCSAAKRAGPHFFSLAAFYITMRNSIAPLLTNNEIFFARVGRSTVLADAHSSTIVLSRASSLCSRLNS